MMVVSIGRLYIANPDTNHTWKYKRFMRETVFTADRKEGLDPACSEGVMRTLFI